MGGDDDDDLYDELYGDEDDAVISLPAAPVAKPNVFKIPKTQPVVEPEPEPEPEPVPEPVGGDDATDGNAASDSDDDFDIALNEPDVGDPDDPDDFKIVLDDTEALYGVGATMQQDGAAGGEYDEYEEDGMQTDQPANAPSSLQNVPPPPPKQISHNSKTYVRDGPPPPAPPPGAPSNLAQARAGPPPPAPPPGRPSAASGASFGQPGGGGACPKYTGPKVNPPPSLRMDNGEWNTYNRNPPNARYDESGVRLLPGGGGGARFIPPDEYKEFLALGHGGIFDADLDNIDVAPWRVPGADLSAYFNFSFTEPRWREYCSQVRHARLELAMMETIQTYDGDYRDTGGAYPHGAPSDGYGSGYADGYGGYTQNGGSNALAMGPGGGTGFSGGGGGMGMQGGPGAPPPPPGPPPPDQPMGFDSPGFAKQVVAHDSLFGGAAAGMDYSALQALGFYPESFGVTKHTPRRRERIAHTDNDDGDDGDDGDDVMVLAGEDDDDVLVLGGGGDDGDGGDDGKSKSTTKDTDEKTEKETEPTSDDPHKEHEQPDAIVRDAFELGDLDARAVRKVPLAQIMQGMQILQMRHVSLVQMVASDSENAGFCDPLRLKAESGQKRMLELREAAMQVQEMMQRQQQSTVPFGGGIGDRACHACGERGHFARECPMAGAGGGGEKRACHSCGQHGHLAKDCPQGPVAGDRACHVCGEVGHLARDCTKATCNKCGKPGHKQYECPESKCFKCGGTGHFAKDCVNPPQQRDPPQFTRDHRRDGPPDTDRRPSGGNDPAMHPRDQIRGAHDRPSNAPRGRENDARDGAMDHRRRDAGDDRRRVVVVKRAPRDAPSGRREEAAGRRGDDGNDNRREEPFRREEPSRRGDDRNDATGNDDGQDAALRDDQREAAEGRDDRGRDDRGRDDRGRDDRNRDVRGRDDRDRDVRGRDARDRRPDDRDRRSDPRDRRPDDRDRRPDNRDRRPDDRPRSGDKRNNNNGYDDSRDRDASVKRARRR